MGVMDYPRPQEQEGSCVYIYLYHSSGRRVTMVFHGETRSQVWFARQQAMVPSHRLWILFILVFVFAVGSPSHAVNQNQGLVLTRRALYHQGPLPHQ